MILVTGATGFIGMYMVDHFINEGEEVLAVGHSGEGKSYIEKMGASYQKLDITQKTDFKELPKDIDTVVHLAGLLSIDIWEPEDYLKVNTMGTLNLLDFCQENDVDKIVYSMTHSDVNRTDDLVITEETPQKFGGSRGYARAYIVSKIAAMNLIDSYSLDYDLKGVSLRFPGIRGYGARFISFWKGNPQVSAFYKFIQNAMHNKPIEIWGEHKTVRDLVYIKDVVSGISLACKNEKANGLYNIASGEGITIEDEAKSIINAFSSPGTPSKLIYRPEIEELEKRSYIFDITKAKKELNYHPKYSYDDAMKDYKEVMESGRFKSLISRQENVLESKTGIKIKQLLS